MFPFKPWKNAIPIIIYLFKHYSKHKILPIEAFSPQRESSVTGTYIL
jgi:hypothetical protein